MNPPFQIKVCGITSVAGAQQCATAGADAIGLNFYAPSPRSVGIEKAREIARTLPDAVTPIGLFVNESASRINRVADELSLDWVQLHGDEAPEFLSQLDSRLSILRAYRFGGWEALLEDLASCKQAGRMPNALLIDAKVDGSFGGTGEQAEWQALADCKNFAQGIPLILAGGLTPENVAEAIRIVRPDGVDTASGVESSPGVKDPKLVAAFVTAARDAFGDG